MKAASVRPLFDAKLAIGDPQSDKLPPVLCGHVKIGKVVWANVNSNLPGRAFWVLRWSTSLPALLSSKKDLAGQFKYDTSKYHMTPLSTEQVAKQIGISRVTLERWLASGKLRRPASIKFGRNEFRNWTAADVERVRKYKEQNYRKGRGRKPRAKR